MDPELIPMMIFTIIVIGMVGGFVLLLPITRTLGRYLEYRMSQKARVEDQERMDLLLRAVESLRDDVARLAERQDFTEKLLERPKDEKADRRG
ncbi:MAG: hypothetical protein FIA95_10905 [Gemmatimonadetes bacterium]|nr:hypothetical protein [Gemmatimonadota bacterium]